VQGRDEHEEEIPREVSTVQRVGVAGVLVALVAVVAIVLFSGDTYRVDAHFVNASQLVKGTLVTVAGEPVGKVDDISLTDDGQANIAMSIDDAYAPLREGTRAVVRQRSLSGAASNYVELQLGGAGQKNIPDGGTIPGASTESNVTLDQIFDMFDPKTRAATQKTIRFLNDVNAGREARANAAIQYLNPALSASSRLFGELGRNKADLERFVVATSGLVTDISARDDDLAGLVTNLGTTMDALAAERQDLGTAVELLPTFLRRANTTFANLRAALDDLDPLVETAKPIVRNELRPLFAVLRPFAVAARPTVRDLSRTVRRPGAGNDLVELLRKQPAVDAIANTTAERNGKERPGAFKATQQANVGITPQLSFLRPYAPELVGWFDDFSSSGPNDAIGSFSRAGLELNQFTLLPTLDAILPVPPALRDALAGATLSTGRNNRCPGSLERGALWKPTADFNCDPKQVPIGR
jgi:phospholipid/cholesterol/gamma-HCH transport system substrate-binding protein